MSSTKKATSLPTFEKCSSADEGKQASALELFILHNTPAGTPEEETAWRQTLADAIEEVSGVRLGVVPDEDDNDDVT